MVGDRWGWGLSGDGHDGWIVKAHRLFWFGSIHACRDGAGKEVGYACVRLRLEEDSHGLFLAARPRKAPRPPEVGLWGEWEGG